jgi:predicted DNA binding CopG/RHH family protein
MRLPSGLLDELKTVAGEEKVPYQRLMRELIEKGLAARRTERKKKRAS